MKRTGNLIEHIADIDNLRFAFLKAKRRKMFSKQVQNFQANLDVNLLELRRQLLSADVNVGDNHYFTIYEPKERQICSCSFLEKVMHHALMNVCHSVFETYQIHHSYASRIGKGTHAAITQAQQWSKKNIWFLKMDIRKYFASIDGEILKKLLVRRIKDKKVLHILDAIIDVNTDDNGKGIPIGNLTSQYFANHYLAIADRYIKEQLKVKRYMRYMDDMVLWSEDKALLKQYKKDITIFLEQRLQIYLKPTLLNICSKGLPFLGFQIFPNKIKLCRESKKRFVKKFCQVHSNYTRQKESEKKCQMQSESLFSFVQFADTLSFRKKIVLDVTGLSL